MCTLYNYFIYIQIYSHIYSHIFRVEFREPEGQEDYVNWVNVMREAHE